MSKGIRQKRARTAKKQRTAKRTAKRERTAKKPKGIVVINGEQYYSDIPPASQASQQFRDMMKADTGIFKGWRKHPTRWPVYHNGVKIYYH
jgi:hypothetical protein